LPVDGPLDPSLINTSPLSLDYDTILSEDEKRRKHAINRLTVENALLTDELESTKARLDIKSQKALLLRPFSWWVLVFVSFYCIIIFAMIVLDGACESVNINGTVLGIVAGGTAVAVVGLISVILTGLFKSE
jgi:hypothetical protein